MEPNKATSSDRARKYRAALEQRAQEMGVDPDVLQSRFTEIIEKGRAIVSKIQMERVVEECCPDQRDYILFLIQTGCLLQDLHIHLDVKKCPRCVNALEIVEGFDSKAFQRLSASRQKLCSLDKEMKILQRIFIGVGSLAFAVLVIFIVIDCFHGLFFRR